MSGARPDTWMPFYIGDYLGDTMHLSTPQHGAYLLLIFAYWRRGKALPDDDIELSAICRLPVKEWLKAFRVTIARFFVINAGEWVHGRIEQELSKARAFTERAAKGGRAKASSSDQAAPEHGISSLLALNKQPLSSPQAPAKTLHTPSPSPSPKEETNSLSSASRPPPRKRSARLLNGLGEQFEEAYLAFPRHVARGAAERAFSAALAETDYPTLLAGVRAYAQSVVGKEPQYVKHFATWLRAKCWLDQPATGSVLSELAAPRGPPPALQGERLGEPE